MNTARHVGVFVLGLFCCGAVYGAHYPLKVKSINPRLLVDQDNVPFLIVGDSPHSLIVNLSTSDAASYLADRAAHGMNSLWVELFSVGYTGGRPNGAMLDGTKPFTKTIPGTGFYDLTSPNEAYFAHVDEIIRMAATNGIVVMLDPIDTAGLRQTALANGSTRCRAYGQYLGNRYKNFPNLIWLSGNDFQTWRIATNDAVFTSVALGIKDKDPNHLQTVELNYQASCSLDDPNWASIVGLNLAYTYYATYAEVLHGYNQSPTLPVFMGEANFEYETNNDEDGGSPHVLRMQEYWTMLSGAAGQLYGNHYTWTFLPGWQNHLDSPGVVQLGYMENLFKSVKWYDLVPDQKHTFVTAGYGRFISTGPPATPAHGRFAQNNYVTAALTPDGTLGMAYLPQGGTITVAMNKLQNRITARWFDPTDNRFEAIAGSPFSNRGRHRFTSPGKNSSGDPDWVLVLETSADTFVGQTQGGAWQSQAIKQTQAELAHVQTAIDRYHAAYGFYPPDNNLANGDPLSNQLYYELEGTFFTNGFFETLDGNTNANISAGSVYNVFNVGSFANCNRTSPSEGRQRAGNFIPDLSPRQIGTESNRDNTIGWTILVGSVGGPDPAYRPLKVSGLNPWRYVSPGVHNPASYDLWIQLSISGKKYLVCNWSKKVQIDNPAP